MSIRHHIPDLGSTINRGTIGWWVVDTDFAANPSFGGNLLYDTSNFRRPMALTNMDPATDWTIADGRRCLDFDGSNDSAIGRCTVQGASGFAMATWVRIATNQLGYIVSMPNASASNGVDIYLNGTNSIRCWANTSGGNSGITGTYTYAGAGWLRIVSTYDGANHKLYINGGEVQTGAKTGTVNTGLGEINVGDFGTGFSDPAACQIAEVRVWNRGLTPSEVWQDYRRWMDFHQQYTRRRARRPVSLPTITGTASITQDANTMAGAGAVMVAGSAAIAQAENTAAAAGAVAVIAAAGITQDAQAVAAVAMATVSGAASVTQDAGSLTADGAVVVSAEAAITQAAQSLAGVAAVAVSGSAGITQDGNTVEATAGGLAASAAITQDSQAIASVGTVTVAASATIAQAGSTLSATGTTGEAGIGRSPFQSRIFSSRIFGGSRG